MTRNPARSPIRILTECAVLLALSCVLSLIKIPLPWLVFGGSVTLCSMLPLLLISLRYGVGMGTACGFLYACLQFLFDMSRVLAWGLSPAVLAGCILLDYLLAFTVLGTAGIFLRLRRHSGKTAIFLGVAFAMLLRLAAHVASGMILWGVAEEFLDTFGTHTFLYSLCYNGSFMLPELIFTGIALALLLRSSAFRGLLHIGEAAPSK